MRAARPRDARNEAGSLTQRLIIVYIHVSKMHNIYISGRREVTMDPIHNSRCKPVLTGNFIKFYQIIFDVWIQLM